MLGKVRTSDLEVNTEKPSYVMKSPGRQQVTLRGQWKTLENSIEKPKEKQCNVLLQGIKTVNRRDAYTEKKEIDKDNYCNICKQLIMR